MKIFGFTIFEPNKLVDRPIVTSELEAPAEKPKTTSDEYQVFSPETMEANSFNSVAVARELVGMAMNTQARQILGGFSFTQTGSIAVGNYVNGTSGDIRISPSGIVGRNSAGVTTFTIDGTTGDATFYGTVTATAGLIGGFTLAVGYMYAGTGANTAGMSPADYPFWAGNTYANRAIAPFTVTPAGAVTATSGTIAGWVLSTTTFSNNTVILDSTGKITVADGDSKIELLVDSGEGYIDFYYGGTLRGRMRGTAVGTGIRVVAGDFVIENNKSLMLENTTGNDWGRLGVNTSNQVVMVLTSDDQFFIKNSAETDNLFTVSATATYSDNDVYIGAVDDDHLAATRKWVDDNYVHVP